MGQVFLKLKTLYLAWKYKVIPLEACHFQREPPSKRRHCRKKLINQEETKQRQIQKDRESRKDEKRKTERKDEGDQEQQSKEEEGEKTCLPVIYPPPAQIRLYPLVCLLFRRELTHNPMGFFISSQLHKFVFFIYVLCALSFWCVCYTMHRSEDNVKKSQREVDWRREDWDMKVDCTR